MPRKRAKAFPKSRKSSSRSLEHGNFRMSSRFYPLFGLLFLLGFVGLTGCKTDDEAHFGHMASVVILGHTRAEILQATATVLKADGYHETDELTFDKPGSAWETANYGGWSSDTVGVRIRFALVS